MFIQLINCLLAFHCLFLVNSSFAILSFASFSVCCFMLKYFFRNLILNTSEAEQVNTVELTPTLSSFLCTVFLQISLTSKVCSIFLSCLLAARFVFTLLCELISYNNIVRYLEILKITSKSDHPISKHTNKSEITHIAKYSYSLHLVHILSFLRKLSSE